MKLIFIGAPGSGKGTQAEIFSKELKIPSISTGNILRSEVKSCSELGNRIKDTINKGILVPDDMIIELVMKRIKEPDCKNGYILDGFPRTIDQGVVLDEKVNIDKVIVFNIKDEDLIQRLGGRRSCQKCNIVYHIKSKPPLLNNECDLCHSKLIIRDDDKIDVIKDRLEIYNKLTVPVIDHYKKIDKTHFINCTDCIEENTESIRRCIYEN